MSRFGLQGQGNANLNPETRKLLPISQANVEGRNHLHVLNSLNKPPRTLGDATKTIERTVILHSRHRPDTIDTNVNDWVVDLGEPMEDVTTIELVEACIPKSREVINATNNLLHFSEDAGVTTLTTTIPVGDYTGAQLAAEIAVQMIATSLALGAGHTYTCVVAGTATNAGVAGTITITKTVGGGTLDLMFAGPTRIQQTFKRRDVTSLRQMYPVNSIAYYLGFAAAQATGALTYTGANKFDLSGDKYVGLEITPNGNASGMTDTRSNAPGFDNMFAVLSLEGNQNTPIWHKSNQDSQIIRHMDHKKLSGFRIRFWDEDNVAYDFRGLHHMLKFRIVMEPR
jgi:hypothetical protein